jgi:hypothetical protein
MATMSADVCLEVVRGASHLFEEAGALEQVARLAGIWFEQCLLKKPGFSRMSAK